MKKIKKATPHARLIEVSSDDRGVFVPFLTHASALEDSKLAIKRLYYVYNYGVGTIRGFHFHKYEWKYFMVALGAAKINALDPDKPNQIYTFISSSRKPNLVVIPPGYANGWVSLEENTVFICASTSTLEESIIDDKRFDPYTWGDIWKVVGR